MHFAGRKALALEPPGTGQEEGFHTANSEGESHDGMLIMLENQWSLCQSEGMIEPMRGVGERGAASGPPPPSVTKFDSTLYPNGLEAAEPVRHKIQGPRGVSPQHWSMRPLCQPTPTRMDSSSRHPSPHSGVEAETSRSQSYGFPRAGIERGSGRPVSDLRGDGWLLLSCGCL